jgi:hypothetical protein
MLSKCTHVYTPPHISQVVVEVDISSAEVPAEQCGVRGEDGGHLELPKPTEKEANPCQPLVEVGDHHGRGAREPGHKLRGMGNVVSQWMGGWGGTR